MKKNQKRSNLGKLVLTCKNYQDLRRQLQNDTELLGREISGLMTRQYLDKKTGDQKVINSVTLKLTDGLNTFLGEITGERAVNCPKYDPQYLYKVQCSMVVREWNSQQTGEAMQATTIYIDKINLV